jgi:hypothetical protein
MFVPVPTRCHAQIRHNSVRLGSEWLYSQCATVATISFEGRVSEAAPRVRLGAFSEAHSRLDGRAHPAPARLAPATLRGGEDQMVDVGRITRMSEQSNSNEDLQAVIDLRNAAWVLRMQRALLRRREALDQLKDVNRSYFVNSRAGLRRRLLVMAEIAQIRSAIESMKAEPGDPTDEAPDSSLTPTDRRGRRCR